MIKLNKATNQNHFIIIETLANTIWREHYPSIITIAQIDYMLEKFNSINAIEAQVSEGVNFYYMTFNETPVGYMAIKKETDFLFLSKLYVLKNYRGKGVGTVTTQFIMDEAAKGKLKSIQLKVNKYNLNSIAAYQKMGYKKVKSMVTDIGEGFIMDDYLLEKKISPQ
ncbi:hypothetical protein GCM10022291_23650 [Postechiella marina]|uniref:N-acetyltransferase domain-containing protein n=1 Tax=Postechiella marina TaxID=943941 RepID=A0ABP8CBU1_9FLAO